MKKRALTEGKMLTNVKSPPKTPTRPMSPPPGRYPNKHNQDSDKDGLKLFIFKIHEDCAYVDGIILIVAKSYEGAEQIYKERGKKEDKFSHWRNPILRHRPAALKYAYLDPWYLAETLELKDGATKEGILLVTYHDVVAYHDG